MFSPLFQSDAKDAQSDAKSDAKDAHGCIIVIQCDSGHINGDLIACARYRIYDERVKALEKEGINVVHVLFIINLPHQFSTSTFVGFQGDPWISTHIDDLRAYSQDTIEPQLAISATISELFIGNYLGHILALLESAYLLPRQQVSHSYSEEGSPEEETPFLYIDVEDDKGTIQRQSHILCGSDEQQEMCEDLPPPKKSEETSLEPQSPHHSYQDDETEQSPEHTTQHQGRNHNGDILDSEEAEDEQLSAIGRSGDYAETEDQKPKKDDLMTTVTKAKQKYPVVVREDSVNKLTSDSSEIPKSKLPLLTADHQHPIAQCRRLYGCIQAAASKLEDATKDRSTQRVTRLMKLIPRDPADFIGNKLSGNSRKMFPYNYYIDVRPLQLLWNSGNAPLQSSSRTGSR